MPDYSKGKIYKLYNEDEPDKCYVGSTVRELSDRYSNHKNNLNCISRILFENNKTPIIELLEEYPCVSKKELEIRERYWIEQYPNKINIQIPSRTQQEWNDEHKDKMKENKKQYHIENKDKILEQKRQYRIENREKILKYAKEYYLRKKLSTDNSTQNNS